MLVAVAHAPGIVHAWRGILANGLDLEYLGGFLWLTVAMAFFALKVFDLPCLRFRTDLRSWVALGMVVGLLHVDVIRQGSEPSLVPDGTAVLATAWAIGTIAPVRRLWRESLASLETALRPRHASATLHDTLWFAALKPHCWLLAQRLFNHRAPPALT